MTLPFRPGKLRINGHGLIRATINPAALRSASGADQNQDPEAELDETTGYWHLDVFPASGGSFPFVAISDMHMTAESMFLGATLGSSVELPPRVKPQEVDRDALAAAIRWLAGESLWDATTGVIRQLAAMSGIDELVIPRRPPLEGDTFPLGK